MGGLSQEKCCHDTTRRWEFVVKEKMKRDVAQTREGGELEVGHYLGCDRVLQEKGKFAFRDRTMSKDGGEREDCGALEGEAAT